jgi:hypothetical protein
MTVHDDLTCEAFNDMAPAYALAAVDELERAACTRHLALTGPHRGCHEALAEAQRVTIRLSAAVPAHAPSPRLWRAIEARIADVPTGAGTVDLGSSLLKPAPADRLVVSGDGADATSPSASRAGLAET